jgi:two-component system, sensor histidine kinase and response regulator
MEALVRWLENRFEAIPLPLLEAWGSASYVLGWLLALLAFGRFTLRPGHAWGLARERQTWDAQAFLCLPLTFVLILATGYLGSFVVLVPGAQTLESLKDLVVLLCIVLFGYPALVMVPFAYGLSDLIEGVPPEFLLNWLPGYFINPACFWVAYQLFGKNPDFRRRATWARYVLFVVVFLSIEPALWGHLCRSEFTPAISYRTVTPALFFTTGITWLLAPAVMLVALPLARKTGLFWADIEGHVKERFLGHATWVWESGTAAEARSNVVAAGRLPIRMAIVAPFIALVVVMVATTAYVAHSSNFEEANRVATLFQRQALSDVTLRLRASGGANHAAVGAALAGATTRKSHRVVIADRSGRVLQASEETPQTVLDGVSRGVREKLRDLDAPGSSASFHFDQVTPKPLARETYFARAAAFDASPGHEWIIVSVLPASAYLRGMREVDRRSAVVLGVALVSALLLAAVVSALVSAPIQRVADAVRALARGELGERVPQSRWEEANALADSFNHMAARLEASFQELVREVEVRKKRERELEASESRLRVSENRVRLAVQAASVGIWDWDVPSGGLIWDESMCRLYGLDAADFGGTIQAWERCIVPEDAERTLADVNAAFRGEREFAAEFRIRRPDGSVRMIRGRGDVFRDAEGNALRMIGINWDVTEQRETEQELRRHRDHLEELVRERTDQLTSAKEQADAANRAKSAFLANMSHEIRTPMNAILGFGQLMRRDASLSPRDRERVGKILTSGEHLLELINNVLDMSKIEAGGIALRCATFDLHEAIRDVDAMIRVRAESKGLRLELEGISRLPRYVRSDVAKTRQMLLNLLGNAVKFTREGRVSLLADSRASARGAILTFTVEDTGVGIADDELDRVFEPFGQTASGIASRSGTGLGMPITRDFARLLGGDLTVRSVLGRGTTFVLTLDVWVGAFSDLAQRGSPRAGPVKLVPGRPPPKILVVDDEEDNRVVLAELLESAGLLVIVAVDGLEALERFAAEQPDFVFMDVKMPRMDGIEAIRRIRQRPEGAKVPIVALSASVYEQESGLVVREGANAFIAKPFREERIWEILEAELGVSFVGSGHEGAAPPPGEPSRDDVAALGEESLSALRAALENGDVDRAGELLSSLGDRHAPVVSVFRRRLADFDIEGALALTSVRHG